MRESEKERTEKEKRETEDLLDKVFFYPWCFTVHRGNKTYRYAREAEIGTSGAGVTTSLRGKS